MLPRMISFQLLKSIHLTCAVLSISGFLLRGFWMIKNSPLLQHRLTKILPHIVDTLLLASAIWMTVMTKEDYAAKYEIEVRYISEMSEYLVSNYGQATGSTVYVNRGVNSDSKLVTAIPEQNYLEGLTVNVEALHDILSESRTIKNDDEILALRWASQIASESHVNVLKNCKPGMRESQLESFFVFHGQQDYFIGRVEPYLSICGCGPTAATLHYQDNDKTLIDGQTMLTD